MKEETIQQIAQVCYEANRAFCSTLGDHSQQPWHEAEQWQRNSAITGVSFRLSSPLSPSSAQHKAWLADKTAAGWTYGPVKNPVAKTHPCMVPYHELPLEQQLKNALFTSTVESLRPLTQ